MEFYRKEFTKIRKEKRWSISRLAQDSGISRKAISTWEKGITQPKLSNLKKICFSLDVDICKITSVPKNEKVNTNQNDNILFTSEVSEILNLSLDSEPVSNAFKTLDLLNKNFKKFSAIANGVLYYSDIATYVKDVNNKYLYANEAFLKQFNVNKSIDEISGLTDIAILSRDLANNNKEEDMNLILSNKSLNKSTRTLKFGNEEKLCLISKIPILDKDKKVIGLIGKVIDIEHIKEYKIYKNIIQAIINNIEHGFWLINCITEKNVCAVTPLFINNSLEKKLGKNKQKLTSKAETFNNYLKLNDIIPSILKMRNNESIKRSFTIFNIFENRQYTVSETIIVIDNYILGISSFSD